MIKHGDIGAVVIGRNEGNRLIRCLTSLQGLVARVIYVDSGSTDGSLNNASKAGAEVLQLASDQPFTAARARNAGLTALAMDTDLTYVQFIDGDCELQPGWIATARSFLDASNEAVVACGRRRERHPEASVYNRLVDQEWDTPVGPTHACGGDALMKIEAVQAVGGFNPHLIAGEEPELCVRLRAAGGEIHRLDAEMTLHDAQITRFEQWWQRSKRAGYAYAEGSAMHGALPEGHKVTETRRAILWGIALPAVTILTLLVTPLALIFLLIWPLQIVRLCRSGMSLVTATFLTFGKLPEGQGVLQYHWHRWQGKTATLIEYK